MAEKVATIGSFSMTSTWPVNGPVSVSYSTKTFSLSGLPNGAIIDNAVLSCTRNNPSSGIKSWRVDGTSWNGTINVTEKLQSLNGVYTDGVPFQYRYQADPSTDAPGSSTLTQSNNELTITYHPPASTFTTSPTTTVNVDTNITVTITPVDPAYSHKIIRTIGSNTATYTVAVGYTSAVIQIPASWIPSASSATATIKVETYNGTSKTGENSKTLTVNVPNSAPYLPTISLPDPEHVHGAVPAEWVSYTKGQSKAKLDPTCTPGSGSTVKTVAVSNGAIGNAALVSGSLYSFTTGFLTTVGTITFRVTFTDNRNRSVYAEKSITVYDYFQPSATQSTAYRCTSDGTQSASGTYIRLNPVFSFASVNGENSLPYAKYAYKQLPSGSWSSDVTVTSGTPVTVGSGAIDVNNAYQVRFVVRDELYPNVVQGEFYIDIGTEWNVLQFYGDRQIAAFKACEYDGFEVGGGLPFRAEGVQWTIPSRRNLLINGDFSVWPMGSVTLTAGSASWKYTAARWRAKSASAAVVSNTGGLKVSAATQVQYVMDTDDYNKISGKAVTLSYSKNGTVYTSTFTASSATVVDLNLLTNDVLNWAKLDYGSVATPFIPNKYLDEVAACQGYYYIMGGGAYEKFAIGMYSGATIASIIFKLPVAMRAAPSSVTLSGSFSLSGTVLSGTAFYNDGSTKDTIALRSDSVTGKTPGYSFLMYANNDTTARIIIDAEIY